MSAGQFVGRVGGIAAALGVGVVLFGGTAVAVADDAPSTRGSASNADSSAGPARSARGASAVAVAVKDAPAVRARAVTPAPDLTETISNALPAASVAAPSVSSLPAPAPSAVTLPAPSATAPAAASGDVVVEPKAFAENPPNPNAVTPTPYGPLGQWMLNKTGAIADWVGLPYCGKGSTSANCKPDTPGAKKMQEPINTIFVVKASSKYAAEVKLDFVLRAGGFGPSCCSSIGYRALLGTNPETNPWLQMPRAGLLGTGFLAPLPFGLGQNGLLGFTGIGPAYRDAPFFLANSHLRTFGGESDGKGNYIFTASVSKENLDTTTGGLLPTHGFESYNEARTKLLDNMIKRSWITGASNMGMVAMNNQIDPANPTYTTGDHDGLAQVIAIGSMFASSPARSLPARAVAPARAVVAV